MIIHGSVFSSLWTRNKANLQILVLDLHKITLHLPRGDQENIDVKEDEWWEILASV